MPKIIGRYQTTVEVGIPDCDRTPFFAALAKVFNGKKRGTLKHQQACYSLCRVVRVNVEVQVHADGSKTVKLA